MTFNLSEEEALNKIRKKLRKEFDGFDETIKSWYKNFKNALYHNLTWAEVAIAKNQVYFPSSQNTEDFISPIKKVNESKIGNSQWRLIFNIIVKKREDDFQMTYEAIPLYPEKFNLLIEAEENIQEQKQIKEWQDDF